MFVDFDFKDGKWYIDFNVKIDKVVEYGLVVLVGGIVVKKLGLFVVMVVFLVKFVKVVILVVVGFGVVIVKFFKCKLSV